MILDEDKGKKNAWIYCSKTSEGEYNGHLLSLRSMAVLSSRAVFLPSSAFMT